MIPLYKPYMPELPDIDAILHSGALAYGQYTKLFEAMLKDFFNTQYLIVTNSFNTAISVTLTTLGLAPGDTVIASPMACLASTQPYLSSGIKVRWADVDPKTGTLCPDSVKHNVTKGTKAIIHNHFCGYPGYIDEINRIGHEYGIPIIDDGIECFGSKYKGRLIGNCGTEVTIFSLNPVRFCNCIDGGVVIFKNKEQYERSLLIRDCGIDRVNFRDELGEIRSECDIKLIGYSATMSNVNGYIGIQQMKDIHKLLEAHQKQAIVWKQQLVGSRYHPIERNECDPNYWVYGILAEEKTETIKRFRNEGFYASGIHIRNDLYSAFGKQNTELPGVDYFYTHFVGLPCGWWM